MKIFAAAVAASLLLTGSPTPEEFPEEVPARETAPVTDDCPNLTSPPPARTTSEANAPAPAPLPVRAATSCGVTLADGYVVPAEQTAAAWLVFDLDSGEIIAAKDPHGRYRPASIIKVLLALVVIRDLDLAEEIVISEDYPGVVGSAVGIGPGGVYTVEQLLSGLLLASGNDAADALAERLGGEDTALAAVNDLAREIGTEDTRAATYSGLDAAGMSTSAADMALVYRYAWQNPDFARLVNTEYLDFPGFGEHEGYQVWNDNGLFMNHPDGIGGKTGFTDDANHTFVGAMDREGRRLGVVILDTTIDLARPWEQARDFLEAAYRVPAGESIGTLLAEDPTITAEPEPEGVPEAQPGPVSEPDWPLIGLVFGGVLVLFLSAACLPLLRRRDR